MSPTNPARPPPPRGRPRGVAGGAGEPVEQVPQPLGRRERLDEGDGRRGERVEDHPGEQRGVGREAVAEAPGEGEDRGGGGAPPSAAPPETPRTNGSARGFRKSACSAQPEAASAAPTTAASATRGRGRPRGGGGYASRAP